ncbi:hypothetical protein TorRG33x02_189300 [Trema orientale]|uniref:Uncharacterized protein n=1 Tax=Trema orientale TaxID=63057 RepID=A0A2P5EI86_TREOI|nr:hypothetical protein TorRG33x02_189300 [Trema orientale]
MCEGKPSSVESRTRTRTRFFCAWPGSRAKTGEANRISITEPSVQAHLPADSEYRKNEALDQRVRVIGA